MSDSKSTDFYLHFENSYFTDWIRVPRDQFYDFCFFVNRSFEVTVDNKSCSDINLFYFLNPYGDKELFAISSSYPIFKK